MPVAEWMTRDPVVTSGDTPLEESLATMIRHRVRHLPVLDDDQSYLGILSAPNLVRQLASGELLEPGLAASPTRDHCQWVQPLAPEDDIPLALQGLETVASLPVVATGKLVGLFSHHNLMSYCMRHLAPQRVRRGGATPAPHRLDSLVSLVRRVSQADGPQGILGSVLASLRPLMPVDQAFILFLERENDLLKVAARYFGPHAQAEPFAEIPARDTLSGYCCLHNRSLRIDDLRLERRFPHSQDLLETTTQIPLRSVICVPLLDQHTSFGVLQFWSLKPYSYLESDLELLELAAGYIASMIQRSWRLEKEKEANRIKDEFLAVVTHDLRNTIQGVLSYSQLLSRKVEEPRLQMLAKGVVESARHMSTLTNDLHDLARLGIQAMRVEPQSCLVQATVDQVVEELNDFAQAEKVEIRSPQVPPELTCRADPVRLRQILSNLVSNAVKYNRPGGWVQIDARSILGGTEIRVEDSGIGIPLEDQTAIFDLFTRAANHRRVDSSGLGLAISKQLAELHGGTLELSSNPGQGSRFTLFLPQGPAGASRALP